MKLERISPEKIAGVCGKFSRPEYRKEGLHLLAEMGADAQLEADQKQLEAIEQLEKRVTLLEAENALLKLEGVAHE